VTGHDWDACYRDGALPWDTASPDPHLVEFVRRHRLASGRALEVGCGTGTNCLWLAEQGFEVLGIDISPTAIEQAESKATGVVPVGFACLDFLKQEVPGGPFDLVFDRGCFHVFDDAVDRALFSERVARAVAPDGVWVSIIGSTEGPARDHGPPRRTARDLANAIEPVLDLVELRATEFHANITSPARAWFCVARPRQVPAQPSTQR
jgi:SAM-dependent methyltransferase